jgi:KTSC domain-containing protein
MGMSQQLIQHTPSTNIANIVYDTETQTLTISFLKGGVVEYYEVPEDVVNGFGTALSSTKYLNAYVENSFPSQRVV